MWRAMLCGLAVAAVACAGTGRRSAEATRPTPEDDVVSVGYGTQSRREITGAVSSYIPTEADARTARLETMLEGHIPGLEVIPQGSGFTLRIRGFRTLRQRGGDDEPVRRELPLRLAHVLARQLRDLREIQLFQYPPQLDGGVAVRRCEVEDLRPAPLRAPQRREAEG